MPHWLLMNISSRPAERPVIRVPSLATSLRVLAAMRKVTIAVLDRLSLKLLEKAGH